MEILFIIGLMALLYIVPEILRSQQRTDYKYPDIPKRHVPRPGLKHQTQIPPTLTNEGAHPLAKKKAAIQPEVEVPNPLEDKPLGGNSVWANGIIMAEVLQPPRAKRLFYYHKGN